MTSFFYQNSIIIFEFVYKNRYLINIAKIIFVLIILYVIYRLISKEIALSKSGYLINILGLLLSCFLVWYLGGIKISYNNDSSCTVEIFDHSITANM